MKKIILAAGALCVFVSMAYAVAMYPFSPDGITTVANITLSGLAIFKGKTAAVAPLDVNGSIKLKSYTKSQLLSFVPGAAGAGQIIGSCSNCTSTTVAVSTGAAAGQVSDIVSKTTVVN